MAEAPRLNSAATVLMSVDGEILTLAIDGAQAPVTAGNFTDLVDRGFYDGIPFHRVVREPQPFVVQAGDPAGKDPTVPLTSLGSGGFVDPATGQERRIPLEIKPQGAAEPIYSQTFDDAGIAAPPQLPHVAGALAMARTPAPDSASSQFYIALQDLPQLDGDYAVFGQVTGGFDAVQGIQEGDRILSAKVVEGALPSRRSAVLDDAARLNDAYNFLNRADLPRTFTVFDDTSQAIALTPEMSQQTPSGARALGGDDTVTGSEGDDVAWGDGGNDVLNGNGGRDYLRGNDDSDRLDGGAGNDHVNGNRGNDTVLGGAGDDVVRGGQDADELFGNDGNDVLAGDFGSDTLTGGAGADTFLLRTDTPESDRLLDFNASEGDRLGIVGIADLGAVTFAEANGGVSVQLADGTVLGVADGVTADVLRGAAFATGFDDAALRL